MNTIPSNLSLEESIKYLSSGPETNIIDAKPESSMAAKALGNYPLYVTFNKSASKEVRSKFPKSTVNKTMNSIEETKALKETLAALRKNFESVDEADYFKYELLEKIKELCKGKGTKRKLVKEIQLAFENSQEVIQVYLLVIIIRLSSYW